MTARRRAAAEQPLAVRPYPVPFWRTLFRLRCPHCGRGTVLLRYAAVRERCATCGFRYLRDADPSYFGGAVFVNYMMSGGLVLGLFLVAVLVTLPDVPWAALSYTAPVVAIGLVLLLHPVSRVIWLTFDVRIRPVTKDEVQ